MNLRLKNQIDREGNDAENKIILNVESYTVDFKRNIVMVEARDRARNFAHHEFEINTTFRDGVPTLEPTHDMQAVADDPQAEFEPTEETDTSSANIVPPVATGADPSIKL